MFCAHSMLCLRVSLCGQCFWGKGFWLLGSHNPSYQPIGSCQGMLRLEKNPFVCLLFCCCVASLEQVYASLGSYQRLTSVLARVPCLIGCLTVSHCNYSMEEVELFFSRSAVKKLFNQSPTTSSARFNRFPAFCAKGGQGGARKCCATTQEQQTLRKTLPVI